MKLHVGSGPHYVEGWVNLDLNTFEGWEKQPDVLGNVFDMYMFEDGTFDKVYCGHLLEHLKFEIAHEAVQEIARVCRPDGQLCFVGPCMDKARTTRQPQWLLDEIPAGWDSDETNPDKLKGFPHLWTATTALTKQILERAGLHNIREVPITEITLANWCNTAVSDPVSRAGLWQCAFLATP